MASAPDDDDYRRLLELRMGLRRFLRWSETHARSAGLTPAQHQLMLAIRGHGDARGPTVGDVARYLFLRHHSAVGLVDRAEAAGLVTREQDEDNLSIVRLRLTRHGASQLDALSQQHLDEVSHLAPTMHALWDALERGHSGATPHPAAHPGGYRAPPAMETFHEGQKIWVEQADGTQRAGIYVGEAEQSWFGGAPGAYVAYPDTRSGEEVAIVRIVARD